jgi:hypothetical protein
LLARGTRATWLVAAILFVAAVVLGVLLLQRPPSAAARRDEALAFSSSFAQDFSSYDYRNFDRDVRAIEGRLTPAFRSEYRKQLDAVDLAGRLQEGRQISTAKVAVAPLLVSLSGKDARTFTVVSQTVTAGDRSSTQKVRVELFLVRGEGGWKVNRIELT